ncbi:hypothetical protein TeGR_g11067 [Tetraparma gracilis]|uniref:Uncharacterized protein n=1 Tax=Tetraparma gracilis TaxID=2962635 RepID=A0ABQ6MZA5_9STRA|nr:hypothetical protein TeGR_g11067 [Tetraparma gracilis]
MEKLPVVLPSLEAGSKRGRGDDGDGGDGGGAAEGGGRMSKRERKEARRRAKEERRSREAEPMEEEPAPAASPSQPAAPAAPPSNPAAPAGPSFPYEVDADDHCESPSIAYSHIAPLLRLALPSPSSPVYDPYYCDGGARRKLEALGFEVRHEKEDCYARWAAGEAPGHGALLTNPPYSADHVEKLMSFLTSGPQRGRPFFLLMPQFFHKHEYYKRLTADLRVFYVVPKKRYVYEPPADFRDRKKSDTHKKSSPFVSMWYCWGGSDGANERLMQAWAKDGNKEECDLARSKSALRDLRRK